MQCLQQRRPLSPHITPQDAGAPSLAVELVRRDCSSRPRERRRGWLAVCVLRDPDWQWPAGVETSEQLPVMQLARCVFVGAE